MAHNIRYEKTKKGYGLGLQLCRDFIRMNKGKFHIVSTPGKAAHFLLQFLLFLKVNPVLIHYTSATPPKHPSKHNGSAVPLVEAIPN